MPKVSIIVPNFNHARFLEQRLDSIFNQTFQDFEVILLDDCSSDNSVEILKRYATYPKVSHLIINEINSGSTFKQWEKGISLAKGEYVWIAESDDWADSDFLKILLTEFYSNKSLGLVYSQSYIVNENGIKQCINTEYTNIIDNNKWLKNYSQIGINEINEYLIRLNTIPNVSAVLFSRDKLKIPKEIFKYSYMGDWFLYCSILIESDISYISEPLNFYRQHSSTVRSKALYYGRREKEYFWLLKFLRQNNNINKEIIKKQIKENLNNWKQKWKNISLLNNLKILIALVVSG